MDKTDFIMGATLIIMNLSILKLLQVCLKTADFKEALREKGASPPGQQPVVPAVPGQPAAPAPPAAPANSAAPAITPTTSYSRLAGIIGAVVLACFYWALANLIIYKAFYTPRDIKDIMDGVGTFTLSGSALFFPYAFNQLSTIFRK